MGRRIVACAALAALVVVLSACKTHGGTSSPPAGHPVTYSANQPAAQPAPKAGPGGAVCLPMPCVRGHDCSACYHSEADRDMGRLRDDLPYGACCDGCEPTPHHHTVYHDPCDPMDKCDRGSH